MGVLNALCRYAIAGPSVVTRTGVLQDHVVIVCDERIEAIVPSSQLPAEMDVQRMDGAYLVPGFIDLHVHGAAGRAYNEGTEEAITAIGTTLLQAGVTTALPTLVSAPVPDLIKGVREVESHRSFKLRGRSSSPNPVGPRLPGVHLEGPYFAPAQAGAQDHRALRVPSDGSAQELLEHSAAISMVSFAPELPGAIRLTEMLVTAGIVAAAGHSNGTVDDLYACTRAGLTHITHIFSGQSTTTRSGPWRVPGILEATLASDGLTVEMIADGKHLPGTLMEIAYRCLGANICLVSDATPGAGLPEGSNYRMADREYRVSDGVGMTPDKSVFGGSTTLISEMLPIIYRTLDISISDAVAMVTAVPAQAAHLDSVGTLEPGKQADLCLLDKDLQLQAVAQAGRWVSYDEAYLSRVDVEAAKNP